MKTSTVNRVFDVEVVATVPHAEIVHYYDGLNIIVSEGNRFEALFANTKTTFTIPVKTWHTLCMPFRILRRLLRIDKGNVFLIDKTKCSMAIVYDYRIFLFTEALGLKLVYTLKNTRSVLHQSICRTDTGMILFGEYWNNPDRTRVLVIGSRDCGNTWDEVYAFPANTVKHIHGCYWDKYEKRIWILTGDFESESYMHIVDDSFENIEILGDGSQAWRAVNIFFEKKYVYWIMDSPLEVSRLIQFDRKTRQIKKLTKFPGPVWYIKRLADGYYLAATAREIGPAVKDSWAYLFLSKDLVNWREISSFKKDLWPMRYFKWGVIGFADGQQTSQDFILFGEALKEIDGKAIHCRITHNGS